MDEKIIKELKSQGWILLFPARTGRGSEEHVCSEFSTREECRPLMNDYRKSVNLPLLNKRFEAE